MMIYIICHVQAQLLNHMRVEVTQVRVIFIVREDRFLNSVTDFKRNMPGAYSFGLFKLFAFLKPQTWHT